MDGGRKIYVEQAMEIPLLVFVLQSVVEVIIDMLIVFPDQTLWLPGLDFVILVAMVCDEDV